MPSPIAHAAMGYVVYRVFRSRMPRMSKEVPRYAGLLTQLSIATVAVSLVPDLDSVPGILLGDLGRFHNGFTHSLVFGLPVALGVGKIIARHQGAHAMGEDIDFEIRILVVTPDLVNKPVELGSGLDQIASPVVDKGIELLGVPGVWLTRLPE